MKERSSRGRPKKDGSKVKKVTLKMTEEEFEDLAYISEISGKSKSDVIRKGIEMCRSLANCGCSLDLTD